MPNIKEITYLQDERGNILVSFGDQVENEDARFFVGMINESQFLCSIDKSKKFELLNEKSPLANCIKQGNYAASIYSLRRVL